MIQVEYDPSAIDCEHGIPHSRCPRAAEWAVKLHLPLTDDGYDQDSTDLACTNHLHVFVNAAAQRVLEVV